MSNLILQLTELILLQQIGSHLPIPHMTLGSIIHQLKTESFGRRYANIINQLQLIMRIRNDSCHDQIIGKERIYALIDILFAQDGKSGILTSLQKIADQNSSSPCMQVNNV